MKKGIIWFGASVSSAMPVAAGAFDAIGTSFNSLLNLYLVSPHMIDLIFFFLFFGLVFRYALNPIKDEKTRKSLAVILGLFVSLSLVFSMRAFGASAFQVAAGTLNDLPFTVLIFSLLVVGMFITGLFLSKEHKVKLFPFMVVLVYELLLHLDWFREFITGQTVFAQLINLLFAISVLAALWIIVMMALGMFKGKGEEGHGHDMHNPFAHIPHSAENHGQQGHNSHGGEHGAEGHGDDHTVHSQMGAAIQQLEEDAEWMSQELASIHEALMFLGGRLDNKDYRNNLLRRLAMVWSRLVEGIQLQRSIRIASGLTPDQQRAIKRHMQQIGRLQAKAFYAIKNAVAALKMNQGDHESH